MVLLPLIWTQTGVQRILDVSVIVTRCYSGEKTSIIGSKIR